MALPKEIIFRSSPVGIITIQAGQMGYKRRVNIRLRRNKSGEVYFRTKHGALYVQLPNSKNIFALRAKRTKKKK